MFEVTSKGGVGGKGIQRGGWGSGGGQYKGPSPTNVGPFCSSPTPEFTGSSLSRGCNARFVDVLRLYVGDHVIPAALCAELCGLFGSVDRNPPRQCGHTQDGPEPILPQGLGRSTQIPPHSGDVPRMGLNHPATSRFGSLDPNPSHQCGR
jgi:hypothetical protein